jgi:hypothetical protein
MWRLGPCKMHQGQGIQELYVYFCSEKMEGEEGCSQDSGVGPTCFKPILRPCSACYHTVV